MAKSNIVLNIRHKQYEYDEDNGQGVLTFDPINETIHVGDKAYPNKNYELISREETLIFTHPDHTYDIKTFIVQEMSPLMTDHIVLTFDGYYDSQIPVKYCNYFDQGVKYISLDNGQTYIISDNFISNDELVGPTNPSTYKVFLQRIKKSIILDDEYGSNGSKNFFKASDIVNATFPKLFSDSTNNLTYLCESCFEDCTKLNHIILPQDIKGLHSYCFKGCSGLKYITLPVSLTNIKDQCFENCINLEEIGIPANVSKIQNGAFAGCVSLHTLVFLGTTPPTFGNDVFHNIANEGIVYVPAGCKATYENVILSLLPNQTDWEVVENE